MPTIACPKCRRRYNLPPEALGRKVRCKACGQQFALATPVEDDLYTLAPDPDPPPPPPSQSSGSSTALKVDLPKGPANPDTYFDRQSGPPSLGFSGLCRDIGLVFLFPRKVGNLISFMFVGIMKTMSVFAGFAGCIGAVAVLIIYGWYAAFQLQVVQQSASGERDLPDLQPEAGLHGLLLPLLRFLAVWFVSHLPFLALGSFLLSTGAVPWDDLERLLEGIFDGNLLGALRSMTASGAAAIGALLATLLFATLLQPILYLCVAVGGIPDLVRVDLMIQTILRTPAAYGLTLLLFTALAWLPGILFFLVTPEDVSASEKLVVNILQNWVDAYCTLVAMSSIGLYYHHMKEKFAWSWG